MRICNFPGSRTIGPPADWNAELDGECGSIFVLDVIDTLSGLPMMYTIYKPTDAEIEAMQQGGALRLGIIGTRHPVFSMAVFGPKAAASINLEPMWDLGPIIEEE